MPALFLDTLKVSTVEKTADSTWAQGGHGNARLINWDYNKQINVTLEDAVCTPASLGLCWDGVLSADWNNGNVDIGTGVCSCKNPVKRISRMEPAYYPRSSNDPFEHLVGRLLPQTGTEGYYSNNNFLNKSEITDGVRIQSVGQVNGHSYRWRLIIESGVRSVAQVPDRFFDLKGRSYPIDWNRKVSVFDGEAPTASNFKDAIIYRIGDSGNITNPHPYIIFDGWMDNHGTGTDGATISLQEYLTDYNFNAKTEIKDSNDGLVRSDGTDGANVAHNVPYSNYESQTLPIREAKYLAIVVDNNDTYHAFVGNGDGEVNSSTDSKIQWYTPKEGVITSHFKGLDMWIRFSSINALNYFLLTKYEQDILRIAPAFRSHPEDNIVNEYRLLTRTREDAQSEWGAWEVSIDWSETKPAVPRDTSTEEYKLEKKQIRIEPADASVNSGNTIIEEQDKNSEAMHNFEGKLWAYVNPRTMQPFDDDYWFHQGEPYYIKSLTIAPDGQQIKGNQITIKADQWPGMYMMVGETWIRSRDTGEDERLQIKIPLCKVSSNQTLTLTADGEPTTFSLSLEVANPRSGAMMEINTYEVATKMVEGENGCFYAIDGSSQVLSE